MAILKNNLSVILIILLLSVSFNVNAQDHGHDHGSKIEIGVASTVVFFAKEKEISNGLHAHLIKNFSHTKFGIGLGYERIFDEHKHNTISLVGSYSPIPQWHITIAPGIAFEGIEMEEPRFAIHAESAYHFEYKKIHWGPLLGFAYDQEDYHISIGLHIGFGI